MQQSGKGGTFVVPSTNITAPGGEFGTIPVGAPYFGQDSINKDFCESISLILLLLFLSTEHRFICVLRTLCLCTLHTRPFDRPRCSFPNFTSCTHTVIITGYFNGTPAAAAAWGLDVIAPIHFGKPGNESVDLVVSGPNEGWNLGPFLSTLSGTLGAAYFAVERGVSEMFVPLVWMASKF